MFGFVQGFVQNVQSNIQSIAAATAKFFSALDLLYPVRQWFNQLEIQDAALAHFICRVVPVQCPFEREIFLFNWKVAHIPPLCKLNPLYEEVVALRFRALCYLADECGEDVRCYC
ncbi:MAG TPA: Mo-dependent nitrogenase C-terminal domain-containing protein [Trichocoleus sp.]|jgi:hypothetical protein